MCACPSAVSFIKQGRVTSDKRRVRSCFNLSLGTYHLSLLLHVLVIRPAAAFGRDPVDDLVRVHDVARLAVDALGEVDLQTTPLRARINHFIDGRRAETLTRVAVRCRATRRG